MYMYKRCKNRPNTEKADIYLKNIHTAKFIYFIPGAVASAVAGYDASCVDFE